MDQLAKNQSESAKQLKALKVGYDQLATERKTLKFVQDKLNKLEELWNQFNVTDDQIRKEYPDKVDHLYYTEDLHSQALKIYEELKLELQQTIFNLEGLSGKQKTEAGDSSDQQIRKAIRMCLKKQAALQAMIERIQFENQSNEFYETKIERLKEEWASIQHQNSLIYELTDKEGEYGYNEQELYELDDKVQNTIVTLKEKLNQSSQRNMSQDKAMDKINKVSVKLPKITIPQFDGDYLKWPQFHDMFSQMVDNQAMEEVEKMWYLKTNLTGDAERLIRHLNVSTHNYTIAWQILNDRYNNKRLLVTSILEKLLNQANVIIDSAGSLKRMFDTTRECILMLENAGIKVKGSWDPLLLHILAKKLDKTTHTYYEQSLKKPKELQSVTEFLDFLESRFQSLEALGTKASSGGNNQRYCKVTSATVGTVGMKCLICGKGHTISNCETFWKMSKQEKEHAVTRNKLCFNCLKKGHYKGSCQSGGCRKCNQKHHTLLHENRVVNLENNERKNQPNQQVTSNPATQKLTAPKVSANIVTPDQRASDDYVFLGTAVATIYTKDQEPVDCRILLDSGSQINFISERLQKKLRLDTNNKNLQVIGIGNTQLQSKDRVNINIRSKIGNFSTMLEAQVIKEITNCQPQRFVDISTWGIPQEMVLADPNFNKPQKVDILLGAEIYGEIMRSRQIKLQPNLPILQQTVFGWVILGKVADIPRERTRFTGMSSHDLNQQLEKFWEIEEVQKEKPLSIMDLKCEEFFQNTTTRDVKGRFIVNLPILSSPELLGNSRDIAMRRFFNLEKKLEKSPELHQEYSRFLEEYLQLGHMEEINEEDIPVNHYFMPHHGIIRPESSTTKIRVVFDASCKTTSNLSLNDIMMKGYKVQDDLFDILLRFRTYKYVLVTDIKQMYRQIRMAEEDQHFQLIIWRKTPRDKLRFYKLTTVTYGTKPAPFLATRCLKQIAVNESIRYPLGTEALKDCYVDDIITGADSLQRAVEVRKQLTNMLHSAGFNLHKWAANHDKILEGIPIKNREIEKEFEEEELGCIKTLGLTWQRSQDLFMYRIKKRTNLDSCTKRSILSEIAQLFDPLGLINPVIVTAKIFIQKLWKEKIDWDQELDHELRQEWETYRDSLTAMNTLKIGRHVLSPVETKRTELHMFADASEKAYGAVAYLRTIDIKGRMQTKLLCSKSRVAPVKIITLPRLELCAALLAAELMQKVKGTLTVSIDQTYLWTDSQIVLSWIQGDAGLFKTYVAHRIADIQKLTKPKDWNHINTKINPADLISRGMSPEQLMRSELWFWGPPFLNMEENQWPKRTISNIRLEEEERKTTAMVSTTRTNSCKDHPIYHIDHRNSFTHLQRSMAYVLRAVNKMRKNDTTVKTEPWLSTEELNNALKEIIRQIQKEHFNEELQQLEKEKQVKRQNRLASLSPFIDEQGILRVGGRLENAPISYEAKHPMLLPGVDFVSKLIFEHLHRQHLHVGPLALLAISRQRFWIIRGRELARTTVSNCVSCTRSNPQLLTQMMGNLPEGRVLPTRPFSTTGVDFCGPIWTHYHIRGKKPQKSYIAVFCCFATKAIHMEVVSDLTTEGFIGALRRFMARRGFCKELFCDNATNFVGAKNKLEELAQIFKEQQNLEKITDYISTKGVQFHFSPPRAPHFGGLWEAAVKSAKRLLQQTLASAALTFEELGTVVSEAEAILNSRPLTPLSSNPNDYTVLTPGHFLIGEPLVTIPEPSPAQHDMSKVTRWKLVAAIRHELWRRWVKEYLVQLQQKTKWRESSANIEPGTLVIMKEENSPPLKWPIGRVEEVFKGNDGLVRVVTVRNSKGTYKRAIHHLAPLPIETSEKQGSESRSMDSDHTSQTSEKNKREREKPKESSRKRPRYSMNSMLIMIVLLFFPLAALGADPPFQISQLEKNPGIYVEHLGQGQLALTKWNIVVYYNMSNYWHSWNIIQKGIHRMMRLVDESPENKYFKVITEQYSYDIKKLKEGNEMLFINKSHLQRKKRGLINIVGSVANKLFGVLDDDYAKSLETTIKDMKGQESKLFKLIKNQTSIIEATTNLVKRSHDTQIEHFKAIQSELEAGTAQWNKVTEELKAEKLASSFLMIAQYTNILINEFQQMQALMLDMITDVHHEKFNPLIITPQQLMDHLKHIKELIPTEVELPNTTQIVKVMEVKCRLMENMVIFVAQVPLVSRSKFELLRFIPLPVRINNTFLRIEPESEYIMTNSHRNRMYSLTHYEYARCKSPEEQLHICEQNHPTYTGKAPSLQCEYLLLAQQKIGNQCQLRISKPGNTWRQLQQKNSWLYTMERETVFNIVCNNKHIQTTLSGSGIITFMSDCELKDDDLEIQAFQARTSKAVLSTQPIIRLPKVLNETLATLTIEKELHLSQETFLETYGKVQNQIVKLKNNEIELMPMSNHDIHQYSIGYSTLGFLIILTIAWIILYRTRNRQTEVPAITVSLAKEDFHIDG